MLNRKRTNLTQDSSIERQTQKSFGLLMISILSICLLNAVAATPVDAQTNTMCSTRWCYVTTQSQTPATCGPPETYVHHSTVLNDSDPFPVSAPQIDITFSGGRVSWWGGYHYGTSVQSITNMTPCYATQIQMQISITAETVSALIVNGAGYVTGNPPVPLTVTDNLGRMQQFDMYG